MRTIEPRAADEQRARQIIGRSILHSETPFFTRLLEVLRDAFANPATDAFDIEFAVNAILEEQPEWKPAAETKEEVDTFYMQNIMEAYQHLTCLPVDVVAAVLTRECEQRNGAFAEAEQLVAMQQAIQAVYDGLDDRTRFLLAFVIRGTFVQSFTDVDGLEFLQTIHNAYGDDSDFLKAHAEGFANDPQLGPLAKAVPLMETLYRVLA
jgi:hypothetical protein